MNLQGRLVFRVVSGGYKEGKGERGTHARNCSAMEDTQTVLRGDRISRIDREDSRRQVVGIAVPCAPSGCQAQN